MTKPHVLALLGRGCTGEVHLAHGGLPGWSQPYVLKRLVPEAEPRVALEARLAHEAALLSRLSHPSLIRGLGWLEVDGRGAVALEYVCGRSAARLVARLAAAGQQLPVDLCLLIGEELAGALDHLHAARDAQGPLGAIHGDLSPSNVCLGRHGEVRLLDLGAAGSRLESPVARRARPPCTPKYASPERLAGEPIGAASDLFALAVTLWELVTGGLLAEAEGACFARRGWPAPSSRRPGVPAVVDQLLKRALSPEPKARFRSASELAAALRAARGARSDGQRLLGAWVRRAFGRELALEDLLLSRHTAQGAVGLNLPLERGAVAPSLQVEARAALGPQRRW